MIEPGTVLLHDALTPGGTSLLFARPEAVIIARDSGEIPGAVTAIKAARDAGRWLAGFFAYEFGLALEERLAPLLGRHGPLCWLGVYGPPDRLDAAAVSAWLAERSGSAAQTSMGAPAMDRQRYGEAFAKVADYIAAGDIYQANLTFQAPFALQGDPVALYRRLSAAQRVAHGALLDTGQQTILSLSPEKFIDNRGGRLSVRPMKGTLKRQPTPQADAAARLALKADDKSRAENLMIVDLMRNDLGRIARIGSVRVTDLFSVETYPTLHQMTSGIEAHLLPDVDPVDAFLSLFPCGSVTGAPKIRAMQVIAEVEAGPRGVYTGSIGHFAPDGDFAFNVAIRTATIARNGTGRIGIGGGIVADSDVAAEYDEALLKMRFLTDPVAPGLIETLLWQSEQEGQKGQEGQGYWLLERHLYRLENSASALAIALDPAEARRLLADAAANFAAPRMRVRLLLDPAEGLSLTAVPLPPAAPAAFRFAIAAEIMDEADPLLLHKTTRRHLYDPPREAAKARLGVDEVVFTNRRGELTEGSITSLFVERDGVLLTPPLTSGVLAGVLRAELLATGRAREAVLHPADLAGGRIFLGNSLRGLMPATLVDPVPDR
jgi:para-aminobenzoate synthetase/4-amino-4-deoxychorismate lyase